MQPPAGERGQVLPLVTVVIVVLAVATVVIGRLGSEASRSAGARTAADAAALAGAADGGAAAREVAEANGAVLVSFECLPGGCVAVVEREGHRATAAARQDR